MATFQPIDQTKRSPSPSVSSRHGLTTIASTPEDVEAARSESEHDEKGNPEKTDEDESNYLHGIKLVLVFIALASSMFLIVLDQTILVPAIPVIASHFNAVGQVGWISSSYFVTQCATIFLWGQALAYFEQKTPLMMAIGIFELGSLIAAVAPNFVALIIGRAVAGLGGAAIMVAVISISSTVIELKKRPIFFGMFGIMFVLGSSLGPIIGGSFTSHVTWRWCFYINLPVGGLSVTAIAFLIPRTKTPVRPAKPAHFALRVLRKIFGAERPTLAIDGFVSRFTSLDWIGGLIVLGGIVSLTLGLIAGGADGWSNKTVIIGLTVAGVAVILLIIWEALIMKEDGLIPLRVARFTSVWGAAGVSFMRMCNSIIIMTYIPLLLQATRHYSSLKSATATLPYAIPMALFAIIGSVVVQKSGRYKWALLLGSAISSIGAGVLYTLTPASSFAKMAGFMVIAAMGAGLVQMNAVLAAQADLDMQGLKADIPQATALVSFMQLIGASIGGSLGGAILNTGVRSHLTSLSTATANAVAQSVEEVWKLSGAERETAITAYSLAMRHVFLTGAVAGAVGFLFALLCRDHNIKGKNYKH